jgi:hypothetical protein
MKKSQNVLVWLRKMVLAESLGWLVKMRTNTVHVQKRVFLISVSRWPIIMIGPGGLQLVIPPPICSSGFRFMGWGCQKKEK